MKFQGARLEDNSGLSLAQSELMMLLLKNMDDDRPLKVKCLDFLTSQILLVQAYFFR